MKKLNEYHDFERPEMLKFLPSKINKCIEFGCAEGLFSSIVKDEFKAECWGVDLNPEPIRIASSNLDRAIAGDAIEVIDSLPENYFDCVICNDFLEHLTYPDVFLEKVRRILKKDAFLVASLPNVRRVSHIFEVLIKKDWRYRAVGVLNNSHFRFYTMKSLKRFLKENNFDIELFQGTRPLPSKIYRSIFTVIDILTFGFNHDMKYNGIGFRAVFK